MPRNPGAWITTTARNKAIDRIRRARRLEDKVRELEALVPAGRGGRDRGQLHPRRAPAADLHLLPSRARARGARGAHVAHARGSADARDRARVPHLGAGDAAAPRPCEAQDPRRPHPVRRPAGPRAARPPRVGARRALPHLQRGLRRDGGRVAGAARAVRRGDSADAHPSRGSCRTSPRWPGCSR